MDQVWKRWIPKMGVLRNGPNDTATRVARLLWHLGAAVWLGSMVFFCFVVTPTVFWKAPSDVAITVIRHLFPLYYGLGLWVGGAAWVGALYLAVWEGHWRNVAKALCTGVAWATTLYTVERLLPLLGSASGSPAALAGWSHWSISLNLFAMGVLAVAMGLEAVQNSRRS